ncbi:glycosyltransferase 61 family protein [Methylorubrum populi]|uniref:glycosyltransferase family 61 protein n=1 Tax=Methylorubrum populi TaxID=223967 RepID=UPI0031F964EF
MDSAYKIVTEYAAPNVHWSGAGLNHLYSENNGIFRLVISDSEKINFKRDFFVFNAATDEVFKSEKYINRSGPDQISALVVDDVKFFDQSIMIWKGEIFSPIPEIAGYMPSIIKGRLSAQGRAEALARRSSKVYDFGIVLSHPHSNMYGHFLTEAVPKLATIKFLYDAGGRFPIFIGRDEGSFVREFIELVIPGADIVSTIGGEVLHIKKCIIPSRHSNYLYHSAILNLFDDLSDRCAQKFQGITFPEKLLLSRAYIGPTFRLLENRDEVYAAAIECGCQPVRCETMSIAEQIAMFRSAKLIFGEYGSAMHNALFSRRGTHVVSMNWINTVQQSISASRGHDITFIMPEGGVPVLAGDGAASSYKISPHLVRLALTIL